MKRRKLNHRRENTRLSLHLVNRIVMMQRRCCPHLADLTFKRQLNWLASKHFRHSFTSHDPDCRRRHASWARHSVYSAELRGWVWAIGAVGLSSLMTHMCRRAGRARSKRCMTHSSRLGCLYEECDCEYDDTCKCPDCKGERAEEFAMGQIEHEYERRHA